MLAGEHNGLLSMDTVQAHRIANKLPAVWFKDLSKFNGLDCPDCGHFNRLTPLVTACSLPTVVKLRNAAFCQQSALNASGYDLRIVASHFHKQHLPTGLVET